MQTRRSTDSLPAIVHSLISERGFDRRADIAISLPHHSFFFADIETDAVGLEKLRQADTASLKDRFPILADDMITQVCSAVRFGNGKHSVLVAATSGESLREELQRLRESKVRPVRVETPVTAAHAAVVVNHPDATRGLATILYVDESTVNLAVTHDRGILFVRNIPLFSAADQEPELLVDQTAEIIGQEVEITWKRLFGDGPDAGLRIFLIASREIAVPLASAIREKIEGQIIPVNPCAKVTRSEGQGADSPYSIAVGLALRTLQPREIHQVNFLDAYHARVPSHLMIAKQLKVCAALAAAAVAVWVIGLFLQLSSLESELVRLKEQAEQVFRQAVPEETTIVNPTVQLQQKLDSFHEEFELSTCFNPGRPAPLEILYALSRQTPARGSLKLQDVLIAADSVRIMGSCDSFATLSEWQRLLEQIPGLRIDDIPTTEKDAESGKVHFTISLLSARGTAS